MKNFYKNKKILITGSSGFVGSWLSTVLYEMGASIYGISLKPNTSPNLFNLLNLENKIKQKYIDICEFNLLNTVIKEISPDIVFHLAAQPLVRESYIETIQTFNTNVIGTLNVLESCKNLGTSVNFICITTDKCYENNEYGERFIESDPMGGKDPYSASKACTEILTKSHAWSCVFASPETQDWLGQFAVLCVPSLDIPRQQDAFFCAVQNFPPLIIHLPFEL